jgi:hypothetical protein
MSARRAAAPRLARELGPGLGLGLAIAFAITGAASAEPASLREAAWLAPGANVVAALTRSPGECLKAPSDEEARYRVEIGRAAFRNPLLLGGPAARAGLSCNACHPDGRANADFFLEGFSGSPGTADVTSALFSRSRDDGVLNPRPIPDLVGAGGKSVFGSTATAHSLEAFIGDVVAGEFAGAPPAPSVLAGLAAYVASLDAAACPEAPQRLTERAALRDVRRALAAADAALARGDRAAADLMLLAAQQELARVDERFARGETAQERALIEAFARAIGGTRAIAATLPGGARVRLEEADLEARRLGWRLRARRDASLYSPERLAASLAPDNRPENSQEPR